jgi:hypothetical protein
MKDKELKERIEEKFEDGQKLNIHPGHDKII